MYALLYLLVSLFWLFLFQRGSKVPSKLLAASFIGGFIIAPIAGKLSGSLELNLLSRSQDFDINQMFLYFLIVAPVEELMKFGVLFIVTLKAKQVAKTADVILLAITVALGFAAIENVFYLYFHDVKSTWPRLLLGNLGHAAYSVFWGYGLGVALLEEAPFTTLINGLIVATLFHGLYNYMIGNSLASAIAALLITLLLWMGMVALLKFERKR